MPPHLPNIGFAAYLDGFLIHAVLKSNGVSLLSKPGSSNCGVDFLNDWAKSLITEELKVDILVALKYVLQADERVIEIGLFSMIILGRIFLSKLFCRVYSQL